MLFRDARHGQKARPRLSACVRYSCRGDAECGVCDSRTINQAAVSAGLLCRRWRRSCGIGEGGGRRRTHTSRLRIRRDARAARHIAHWPKCRRAHGAVLHRPPSTGTATGRFKFLRPCSSRSRAVRKKSAGPPAAAFEGAIARALMLGRHLVLLIRIPYQFHPNRSVVGIPRSRGGAIEKARSTRSGRG